MGIPYYEWINGNGCCEPVNNCGCGNKCDCEYILLEISKLHTDDEILQEEIDAISGETIDAYTKQETDALLDEKLDASAYTPTDLTNYYTKIESDGRFQPIGNYLTKESGDTIYQPIGDYLTEHQPLKTINGNVISGTGNIEITCSGGTITVDDHLDSASTNPAQNKVITEALNDKLDASAYTPTDLSNYVTVSELNQYVLNIQEQINSLISSISGCCVETGETQYRWVTMTGENDYWCSGTTKYSKEKEQESTDGINWVDVNPSVIRNGSTILEEHCAECGYSGGSRIQLTYSSTASPTKIANICSSNVEEVSIASTPNPIIFNNCVTTVNSALTSGNTVTTDKYTATIEDGEYADTNFWFGGVSSEITSIGNGSFSGNTQLSSFTIGNFSRLEPYNQDPDSQLTSIGDYAFKNCTNLKTIGVNRCRTSVPTLGTGAFEGCTSLQRIMVDNSMLNAFKTAPGWSDYSSIIQGI